MNGILLLDKPEGFTSFDAVNKLRHALHEKKIGHGGTLDPMATGVLPIYIGNATKILSLLPEEKKIYEATAILGKETDTEDITGEVIRESEVSVSEDQLLRALYGFLGMYHQVPPMYSAKKVGGKKLYELAREGKEIERKPVWRTVFQLQFQKFQKPEFSFVAEVSSGTYIRSLCRDIGKELGTGAVMTSLRRLKHGNFMIHDCLTLAEILKLIEEGRIEEFLLPVEAMFPEAGSVVTKEENDRFLLNGNPLLFSDCFGEIPEDPQIPVLVYDSGHTLRGIYQADKENEKLIPLKMLLGE